MNVKPLALPILCQNCKKPLDLNLKFASERRFCSHLCGKLFSARKRYKDKNPEARSYVSDEFRLKLKKRELNERIRQENDEKLIDLANRQESEPIYVLKDYCEVCGRKKGDLDYTCRKSQKLGLIRLERHHIRYSPLEEVTLCTKCHKRLHNRFLKQKKVRFSQNTI